MKRIAICRACQVYGAGGRSRIAIPHTCGINQPPLLVTMDMEAWRDIKVGDKLVFYNGRNRIVIDVGGRTVTLKKLYSKGDTIYTYNDLKHKAIDIIKIIPLSHEPSNNKQN